MQSKRTWRPWTTSNQYSACPGFKAAYLRVHVVDRNVGQATTNYAGRTAVTHCRQCNAGSVQSGQGKHEMAQERRERPARDYEGSR